MQYIRMLGKCKEEPTKNNQRRLFWSGGNIFCIIAWKSSNQAVCMCNEVKIPDHGHCETFAEVQSTSDDFFQPVKARELVCELVS